MAKMVNLLCIFHHSLKIGELKWDFWGQTGGRGKAERSPGIACGREAEDSGNGVV